MLARSGFSSSSHSGKDLLQILETYPRDELFQIAQRRPRRHRARACCTCRSAGSCGCSCAATTTAGSCPAWSTCRGTATRPRSATRMEEILLEAFDGVSIDYTALVSESVLARLHFVVRVDPDRGLPDVDPAAGRGRAGARDPVLGRRLRRRAAGQLRRGGGGPARQRLRRRVPRGLQGGPAGRRRRRRPAPAGGAHHRRRHRPEALPAAGRRAGRPPAQALPRRRAGLAVPGAAGAAGDGRRGRRRAAVRDRPVRPPGRLGLRLRAALRAVRRAARRRRPDRCSRTRSPPSGRARPRATASTRWCCGPG